MQWFDINVGMLWQVVHSAGISLSRLHAYKQVPMPHWMLSQAALRSATLPWFRGLKMPNCTHLYWFFFKLKKVAPLLLSKISLSLDQSSLLIWLKYVDKLRFFRQESHYHAFNVPNVQAVT